AAVTSAPTPDDSGRGPEPSRTWLEPAPDSSAAGQRFDSSDPVGGAGVGREETAAAAAARRLHEPAQRVGHLLLAGKAGALQELHAVLVRGVLLGPGVLAQQQLTGDRRDVAAARNDLVEDDHTDVQPGPERLRLLHVIEVLVRELVGEHRLQLGVVRLLQETGRAEQLAVPSPARVD